MKKLTISQRAALIQTLRVLVLRNKISLKYWEDYGECIGASICRQRIHNQKQRIEYLKSI